MKIMTKIMMKIMILLLVKIMKIMILLVEGITSRVADHIWGGCGPPSVYTESELNLENHRTFRKYKLNIEFQSNFCWHPTWRGSPEIEGGGQP